MSYNYTKDNVNRRAGDKMEDNQYEAITRLLERESERRRELGHLVDANFKETKELRKEIKESKWINKIKVFYEDYDEFFSEILPIIMLGIFSILLAIACFQALSLQKEALILLLPLLFLSVSSVVALICKD